MHNVSLFYIYIVGLLFLCPLQAEIITDGSVGEQLTLKGNMQISPTYGQQYGANLFHSFTDLHIQQGESAHFITTPETQYIIARITGETTSLINGQLSAAAHLYLLNPHGFLFAEHASLDIQGQLHLGSVEQLFFEDNTQYQADLTQTVTFTTAPPHAFGLLNAAKIEIQGAELNHHQDISLTASNIILNNSILRLNQAANLYLQANTIQLNKTQLSTDLLTSSQGGSIYLRAQKKIQLSQSIVSSSLGDLFNPAQGQGGDIQIDTPYLLLQQRSSLQTGAFPKTQGQAGYIKIQAYDVELKDLSSFTTLSASAANGGNIQIQAQQVNLDNSLMTASATKIGQAGHLNIDTQDLHLYRTSILSTSALQAGGGDISLTIGRQFLSLHSAITTKAAGRNTIHQGGNIQIQTPKLSVLDQTEMIASAYAGNGGNITFHTDYLLSSPDYVLDASSQLGLAGQIGLRHFEMDMSEAFHQLPQGYLQADNLLKQPCAAKFDLDMSSLTFRHYEVLPPIPLGIQ